MCALLQSKELSIELTIQRQKGTQYTNNSTTRLLTNAYTNNQSESDYATTKRYAALQTERKRCCVLLHKSQKENGRALYSRKCVIC